MFKGFRDFIARGNVMDLAVGVIIGAAFGKIVSSLVSDIINPLLGPLVGRVSFSHLFVALSTEHFDSIEAARAANVPVVSYGVFLDAVQQFLIIAFALYLVIAQVNRLRAVEPAAPAAPTTRECPHCLAQIPLAASRCQMCTSQVEPLRAAG